MHALQLIVARPASLLWTVLTTTNKLSFQTHIKHLQTHAAKHTLVKLTILPILDFGDVIYKIASNTLLSKLDAVYHSAICLVTKAPYTTHHCDLYALVGWPSSRYISLVIPQHFLWPSFLPVLRCQWLERIAKITDAGDTSPSLTSSISCQNSLPITVPVHNL